MALKQQTVPFQIRNPYRLDRPQFDAIEVWQTAIAEEEEEEVVGEEEARRSQQSQRPLPSQPVTNKNSAESVHPSWNGIKKIKDFQSKQKSGLDGTPLDADGHSQQQNCSYFGQTWFGQGIQQRASVQQPAKQKSNQLPIPTITITHHIDTHSELTFERHVEWLTQTALWWDMPVVHLYPAPESPASLEYVETAASRFASWVNFVKISAGEDGPLGGVTSLTKSPQSGKVKGARVIKNAKKGAALDRAASKDLYHEGGMVTGQARRAMGARGESVSSPSKEVEPVIGYVFVGSGEEQAQYHQVFETMGKLYPMIEIRYINSFEPQHLQSRQQQELRDEPCLHSLSWIHYWSAAKESQVLQSKIVNEVVRVRPMWVNSDLLHRSYIPPVLPSPPSPPAIILDCPMFSSSTKSIPTSPSVYIGSDESEGQSLEESLRGVPSTVSIASLLEFDSIMDEPCQADSIDDFQDDQHVSLGYRYDSVQDILSLQESSKHLILSRTQSSLDIRQDNSIKFIGRSIRKLGFSSLSGPGKRGGYRRSISTPLLLLTRDDNGHPMASSSRKNNRSMETMDRCQSNDTNMSPPPLSPTSLTSPTSTSSTSSSTSSTSVSSLGIGHRLVGLAQRFGMYKMRGSSLMTVNL